MAADVAEPDGEIVYKEEIKVRSCI
jgi:hypothetical protein